jgi:dolichol kinase
MDTEAKHELTRKAFHLTGVLLIPLSYIDPILVPTLLVLLCIFYYLEEILAQQGKRLRYLTDIIGQAKRRDRKNGMDLGPYWLALGVGVPFIFFPLAAAQVALLHVCVADAAASLGAIAAPEQVKQRLPHSGRKSWIGSVAFFLVAFFCTLIYFPFGQSLIIAGVGTILESLPPRDLDNIIVPIGVATFIGLMGWAV